MLVNRQIQKRLLGGDEYQWWLWFSAHSSCSVEKFLANWSWNHTELVDCRVTRRQNQQQAHIRSTSPKPCHARCFLEGWRYADVKVKPPSPKLHLGHRRTSVVSITVNERGIIIEEWLKIESFFQLWLWNRGNRLTKVFFRFVVCSFDQILDQTAEIKGLHLGFSRAEYSIFLTKKIA